nr:MAG TPA: hypothetical protein [Inoviridae sp.]
MSGAKAARFGLPAPLPPSSNRWSQNTLRYRAESAWIRGFSVENFSGQMAFCPAFPQMQI